MGFLRSESKQAISDHQNAKAQAEQIAKRDRHESDESTAANQRVADTEKNVSFFRR